MWKTVHSPRVKQVCTLGYYQCYTTIFSALAQWELAQTCHLKLRIMPPAPSIDIANDYILQWTLWSNAWQTMLIAMPTTPRALWYWAATTFPHRMPVLFIHEQSMLESLTVHTKGNKNLSVKWIYTLWAQNSFFHLTCETREPND